MAKRLEDRLDEVRDARSVLAADPTDASARLVLQRALRSRTGMLVESAAEAAGVLRLETLASEIPAALKRFLDLPAKSDPMCRAKRALVQAMRKLPAAVDVRLLRRALCFVQLEPVWGGKVDTAPGVRGTAAIALVESHVPDLALDLAQLIEDPEPEARGLAVRAVAALGSQAAEVLLRHKAIVGDAASEVSADVLGALLEVWPERSRDFVVDILASSADAHVREAAAIALAESRLDGLVEPLLRYADTAPEPGEYRVALLALGMLRDDSATEALMEILTTGMVREAAVAVDALAIQAHRPRLRARVARLVEARADPALREVFADAFPAG